MTQYAINLNNQGKGAVTIMEDDGRIKTWTDSEPNFNHILAAVRRGLNLDDAILFRIPKNITTLSPRVSLEDDVLMFDERPVEGPIQETVIRYTAEGRPLTPIVNFLENLSDNVSDRSRTELFRWLTSQDLQIDDEGYVIGYRGLSANKHSVHSGGAYVLTKDDRDAGVPEPGRWVDGYVPNYVGSIISMDRDDVDDNSGVGCSHGLHIGSERYAREWGDSETTIVVRVNPADVVSVPHGDVEKMRVCRYEILSELQHSIDHEPAVDPSAAQVPSEAFTDAILDEMIPGPFRQKMSRTQRFVSRFRRD